MSSEVKRYKLRGSMPDTAALFLPDEVVSAADYAALEAECERLRVKLMVIASAEPARHGIEWAKAIAAEGNGEPYAKWRDAIEERDALAAELDQAREEIEGMHKSLDKLRAQCAGFSAYAEIDRLTAELGRFSQANRELSEKNVRRREQVRQLRAELAAIKGQEVAGGN